MTSFQSFIRAILVMTVLTGAVAFWGLFSFSALPISAADAWHGILTPVPDQMSQIIVHTIRLPRTLVAILVGACLAVAGNLMQALTQNSLASPSLFGVNAGASLGVALVSTFWAAVSPVSTTLAAMIGGGIAWGLVMLLGGGWRISARRGQLVLAGIAVSALCGAITKAALLLFEDQASSVMVWLAGSFASADWSVWYWFAPCGLVGLVISLLISPKVNLLALGDERAMTLGINLNRLRLLMGAMVLLLVGVCISAVGSLAFVGLMAPHISRRLVGYDHRRLLPVTMLVGGFLCVLADTLSRGIVFPTETPAGAVLGLIGAPCFLYLVRRRTS